MTVYFLWQNFKRTSTKLFKESGPFNKCLFNDWFLVLAPASTTVLILSGLLLFLIGW